MKTEASPSTVYFDGSCALCRAEVGHYRGQDQANALCFVDVSDPGAAVPAGLSQRAAMDRFHVRAVTGELVSGAAAFVEVWSRLPRWRWAARVAGWPGVLAALELGYRLFLPLRPVISRVFGKLQRLRALGRAANG